MARPRQPARSAAYERRDARARAQGYKGYYDYRAHDNGRLPPGQPRLRGERLARARGHRSRADLEAQLREGRLVFTSDTSARDNQGRFRWVEVTVVDERGMERTYRLTGRQATSRALGRLADHARDRGAAVGLWYPPEARTA